MANQKKRGKWAFRQISWIKVWQTLILKANNICTLTLVTLLFFQVHRLHMKNRETKLKGRKVQIHVLLGGDRNEWRSHDSFLHPVQRNVCWLHNMNHQENADPFNHLHGKSNPTSWQEQSGTEQIYLSYYSSNMKEKGKQSLRLPSAHQCRKKKTSWPSRRDLTTLIPESHPMKSSLANLSM